MTGRARILIQRLGLLAAGILLLTGAAPEPLHIIGGPAIGGCIAGAVRLPAEGPGFQTIHLSHSSFWGAPQTIAGIETLAREASAAGLRTLYVEDISLPRGGPMPGGHVAHQIGLDADIGLDMRPRPPLSAADQETVELPSLVRADQRGVEPSRWSPAVVTLLRLAAGLPGIDRVLVNPAIKRQLCSDVTGDRSWLRLIRPWYGHAAHMHLSRPPATVAMRLCNGGSISSMSRRSRQCRTNRLRHRRPASLSWGMRGRAFRPLRANSAPNHKRGGRWRPGFQRGFVAHPPVALAVSANHDGGASRCRPRALLLDKLTGGSGRAGRGGLHPPFRPPIVFAPGRIG